MKKICLSSTLKEMRPPLYCIGNELVLHIDDIDYKVASIVKSISINSGNAFYNYILEKPNIDGTVERWRQNVTENELSCLIHDGRAKVQNKVMI